MTTKIKCDNNYYIRCNTPLRYKNWIPVRSFIFDVNSGSVTNDIDIDIDVGGTIDKQHNWCNEHLLVNTWCAVGVSRLSYGFLFNNPEDAIMFKIVFGL
jgi:hypothetical protein